MESNLTIRIKKNAVFYFLAIIPFTPIEFVSQIFPLWTSFCVIARVVVIVILLCRLLMSKKNPTVPLLLAVIFFAAGLFSTFIADASYNNLLSYSVYLFGIVLLIEDGIFFDIDSMISGILVWFELLIYANLIYYIFNPNGYSNTSNYYHLFGNDNTVIRKLFPGIIFGGIYALRNNGRITVRFSCMFLALAIYLLCVGAMTALVGILCFAVGFLYFSFRGKSGIFKFEIFIVISLMLSVMFAILNQFEIFRWVITNIFGSSMTLSNRVRVWNIMPNIISKRPIFGYGQLSRSDVMNIIGTVDPHNIILGILFYGGILGLVVFAIILVVIRNRIHKCRKLDPSMAALFDSGCCAYFLMWIFEPAANINEFYKLFFFFTLAYFCIDFILIRNENNTPLDSSEKKQAKST